MEMFMNTWLRTACTVLGASVALTLSGTAAAQVASPKIVISNVTPNVEIPLVTASQVQFEADGDLVVQCRLTAGACTGVGGGSGQDGTPPATFSLNAAPTTVNSGASITLTWNSSDSEACYAVAPTGTTGWTSGNRALANSGNATVSITNTTANPVTQTFQIRCFKEGGSRTVSSQTVTINPGSSNPPTGEDYCAQYYGSNMPTSPNFTAHGLTKVEVSFLTIWAGAGQVGGTDVLRGVPGTRLNPATGRYLAIPFVMTDDSGGANSQFTANWNQSQLPDTPSGQVTVTVSPCPGDFRPSTGFGPNPNDYYSTNLCRGLFGNTGEITVDSTGFQNGCYAPKGKRMYINIATYNMYGATLPSGPSCGSNSFCGVMMRMD